MALYPFTLISAAAIVSKLQPSNGASLNRVKQVQILCSFLRFEVLLCSPLESLDEKARKSLDFFSNNQNAFGLQFYSRMISPFMHTLHYFAGYVLAHPVEYNNFSDVEFIRHIVTEMFADQSLFYREAANSESVYNSLKALRTWGAVNELKIELLSEYLTRQVISQLKNFIDEHA